MTEMVFLGKLYPNTLFNAGNVSSFRALTQDDELPCFFFGLIRMKIAVGCLPYCHFPLQTEVLNNAMAVSRCECHGGSRCGV